MARYVESMNEQKPREPIVNDPPIGNPGRDELNAEMSKAIGCMAEQVQTADDAQPHVSRGASGAPAAKSQDAEGPMSYAETLAYLNASIEDAIAREYPPEEIERMRLALEHHKKRSQLRLLHGAGESS